MTEMIRKYVLFSTKNRPKLVSWSVIQTNIFPLRDYIVIQYWAH